MKARTVLGYFLISLPIVSALICAVWISIAFQTWELIIALGIMSVLAYLTTLGAHLLWGPKQPTNDKP